MHMNTPASVPFGVQRLNHTAWKCRDAEETRAFYEDLLGLPLAHVVRADTVPSTGEHCPYVHIFFQLRDGSYIAFFDLGDGKASTLDEGTPGWVDHMALDVGSMEELRAARDRLAAAGVDVIGPVDHHWLHSIYFHDPNGYRMELCFRSLGDEHLGPAAKQAHAALAKWTAEQAARRRAGA